MGYISLALLAITAISLVFGVLWGLWRGRNRAILRLVLVVISAVAAFFLRSVVVDTLLTTDMGEGSIMEMMTGAFAQGEMALPAPLLDLIVALIQIIIGLVAFFIIFYLLKIVTFLFIYPFCKIFVKKGPYTLKQKGKRTKKVYNRRRGWGALVGLVQGIVTAVIICGPLTGLVSTVSTLLTLEINGQPLLGEMELPKELGLDEFKDSAVAKAYGAVGGWLYGSLTTTTVGEGEESGSISLDNAIDAVQTVVGVAGSVQNLGTNFEVLSSETATVQEKIDAMTQLGEDLAEVGANINNLDQGSKDIINGVLSSVKDMIPTEGDDTGIADMFENLTLDDLDLEAIGNALVGIGEYINKTEGELAGVEEVTQEDITNIVNGFAKNKFFLDMITMVGDGEIPEEGLLPFGSEHDAFVVNAINATTLDADGKDLLADVFGVSLG